MRRNEIITLSVAIIILVLGLLALRLYGILELSSKMGTAEAMEIIILFVLVLITTIYVKRTSDITNVAKEQLLSEAQPYFMLRLNIKENEFLQIEVSL